MHLSTTKVFFEVALRQSTEVKGIFILLFFFNGLFRWLGFPGFFFLILPLLAHSVCFLEIPQMAAENS